MTRKDEMVVEGLIARLRMGMTREDIIFAMSGILACYLEDDPCAPGDYRPIMAKIMGAAAEAYLKQIGYELEMPGEGTVIQ